MKIKTKDDRRERIHLRQRKRISGTKERPRLSVFRSVSHIYAQVIDDLSGQTLASASSIDPKLKAAFAKDVRGGNVKGAVAILTILDEPWCRRELLRALEADDCKNRDVTNEYVLVALDESRDAAVRQAAMSRRARRRSGESVWP